MASDPEIKDGFTLPVWMKTKPTKDFEPFAASPPPPEDTFFYIRYPKTDTLFGKTKLAQDLPKLVTEQPKEVGTASAFSTVKDKDWSKHTKPCQDVLHGIAPINTAVNSVSSKPKPAGVDDGFKGEGAACGNSIVKVAHQMISSTRGPRGFTVASPAEDPAEAQYHFARRGSKSLPVTPAHSPPSSPNSRRRMHGNRYFTSPFEPSEEGQGRSWLTMALLGFKKDLAGSTSTLAEEDALDARLHGVTLAESVESLGPAPRDNSKSVHEAAQVRAPSVPSTPSTSAASAFRPKPNELRELNFWSPTSM